MGIAALASRGFLECACGPQAAWPGAKAASAATFADMSADPPRKLWDGQGAAPRERTARKPREQEPPQGPREQKSSNRHSSLNTGNEKK